MKQEVFNLKIEQFLLMGEQDLIRTIQFQQNQINQLRSQLGNSTGVNFEQKYRKALREIHGIINANRQLKEQLDKLKNFRGGEANTKTQIQKEEFSRTHQKLIKEKSQVYSQKEAAQLENQKLRYSIAALEDTVTKLKNDKMALARQREADERFMQDKSTEKSPYDKKYEGGYRDKETELRRTIQNYEQHHATLSQNNRRLEQQCNELANKLFNMETDYKYKLNAKDIQLKELKSIAREEYQGQIANLRKEVAQVRLQNSEFSMKVQYYAEQSQNKLQSENQYEKQLLQTLRDLKLQMEPMSYQISELQDKNQYEKEQTIREKTAMQLKVVELESELERFKENQKMLEQKLVRENQKNRKYEDTQKTIRKLEEENRMLGGRVIVLESKEVALRNRNGDELEERVMEFQTRVEMLLSDKETIASMKNVGIHQLIALKAYIMELDGRLKQVVNENEYAVKKYRSYKEKCTQLIRQLKQHDIAINSLKGKLQGYDRLVVKLQGELERAITINDNEMKAFNLKISQSSITSIEIYKKKYDALVEKLSLQEKYAAQELETVKLNYETKIVDSGMKLEELSQIKETIRLYKTKNEELSQKISEKQNEIMEMRMTRVNIPETSVQPKINTKQIIQKLNQTISTKESEILKLQNQVKGIEAEWKSKYTQFEQSSNTTISKKNRKIEDKSNDIAELENNIKVLRKTNADLESKLFGFQNREMKASEDTVQFKKLQNVSSRISDLEIQLESLQTKYEMEAGRANKMIRNNQELNETNNNMETEITRLKFEGKRIQKELKMELQQKEGEIRRLKMKIRENQDEVSSIPSRAPQIQNYKVNALKMDLEMMESQYQQAELDKNRYYNRTIELQREVSSLSIQVDELNYSLERIKANATNQAMFLQSQKDQQIQNLQYQLRSVSSKVRDLEEEVSNREIEINRIRNQFDRQRQRLMEENDHKDAELNKISRELSRLKFELNNQEDLQNGVKSDMEYKVNKLGQENQSLRDEIESLNNQRARLDSEVRFLKNREQEYSENFSGQQQYIVRLSNDLNVRHNREIQLEEQVSRREEQIKKLGQEISIIQSELTNIQVFIQEKDTQINKLISESYFYKNQKVEWEMEMENWQSAKNRTQSELKLAKSQIQTLEEELQTTQAELSRLKYHHSVNEEQTAGHQIDLGEKQMIIVRLQGDMRIKTEHIGQLSYEIDSLNARIVQLQKQVTEYRNQSSDFQRQMGEKNSLVARLNFQLNSLKARYNDLETENQEKDNNWHNINRELSTIRSQIDSFQTEIQIKDSHIDRFKRQGRELSQQIEKLNEQIFSKNSQINQLNQEIFRLKMEGQEKSSEQIFTMENQIFRLKSKVSSLENQLQMKQDELSKTRTQISVVRASVPVNRYSDDEYDLLQNQFFQLQKTLNETRGTTSEKDIEISQLEGRIEYMAKSEESLKRRLQQQTQQLEQELEQSMRRERELRNKISDLELEMHAGSAKEAQQRQWGLHLATTEVDRLNQIVEDLQEEVSSLRLKLSQLTNQEDRIVENLTVMTLTFAEVEALRDRMMEKQNQIKEVRKSLLNFAGSVEEFNRISSGMTPHKGTQISIEQLGRTNKSIAYEESNAKNVTAYDFQLKKHYENVEIKEQKRSTTIIAKNFQEFSQFSGAMVRDKRLISQQIDLEEEKQSQTLEQRQVQYYDNQNSQNRSVERHYYEQNTETRDNVVQQHQNVEVHRVEATESINSIGRESRQEANFSIQQFPSAHAYQQGQQANQGPSINIQYQQQPMGQQFQPGSPQAHFMPQQAMITPQQNVMMGPRNSVQPRVNFSGGSVHSSFEQGRSVGFQSPVNQVQFGQSVVRNIAHPGHQMGMNLSR